MRIFGVLLALILLNACHSITSNTHLIKSRDNIYLQARPSSGLKIPADFRSVELGEDYPVTGNIYTHSKTPSLLPPGSLVASYNLKK